MHKDSWHIMWQITLAVVFMCKNNWFMMKQVTFALDVWY